LVGKDGDKPTISFYQTTGQYSIFLYFIYQILFIILLFSVVSPLSKYYVFNVYSHKDNGDLNHKTFISSSLSQIKYETPYRDIHLLIIPQEHFDTFWQPCIITDFKSFRQRVNSFHLFLSQVPSVKIKVCFNPRCSNRFWDNRPALLEAPHEKYLLNCFALILCDGSKLLILVQRRIRTAKTGVSGAMDAFGAVVRDEFRRRVVGVEFDLVHSRNDLGYVSNFLEGRKGEFEGR
jgi:hypothetical protein